MPQLYSVNQHPIDTLLTWVKSREIAIPEIQRPFVWNATKVRNLLDSLYKGYPIGYLIAWRNPTVKLKDGTPSAGKRILIDGQQRVASLMAALLGREILTKDYESVRIRIAFHPLEERFEVHNPVIAKDEAWLEDVSKLFSPEADIVELIENYVKRNPKIERSRVSKAFQKLNKIINNSVGIIELAEELDIKTVTEIFIRVNSAGTVLSQADFAMSKISVNEKFGGNMLRKAIDYFCHLAVAPEFYSHIEKNDAAFAKSEFLPQMKWLKDVNEDIYDPTYTDMLRVAFTSEFGRGRLEELVALLSGRNFETREYEEAIAEESFARLKNGICAFMKKTSFDRLVMILSSAGFVTSALIRSANAVNFAYIIYLRGRKEKQKLPAAELEQLVRRWYVMTILTGRYAGTPESAFESDIKRIETEGVKAYVQTVIENELPSTFWTGRLPEALNTASSISPVFIAYQAAQVQLNDKGFLSTDITVRDLLLNRGDKHHVFPRNYMKKMGMNRSRYNQIANFVIAQSEINVAISDKPPEKYFAELLKQCNGGAKRYGGISDEKELRSNLTANCLPLEMLNDKTIDYDEFLVHRRKLMALKIKKWFAGL